MHTISPLKKGDTVGIVAPSAKPAASLLQVGCDVMMSWGLNVELGKYTLEEQSDYLSATDEKRLSDLQTMLDRPDIKAICCARGGYGASRIIDKLDFTLFLKNPKWIIGFSDATAIHLKLHQLGIESVHACMPVQFGESTYRKSVECLRLLLLTPKSKKIKAKPHPFNRYGKAQGRLVGGNLSLLVNALGTATSLDTEGKILILEEVAEPLYKIDRMITQLKRSGKLDKLAGLVLGHVVEPKDVYASFDESWEEIIISKTSEFDYPVAFGFPIGHIAPNLPWNYSAMADLEVDFDKSEIRF